MQKVFCDTEELSVALKHANVSAMQIGKGRFEAQLSYLGFADWSIQSVEFNHGGSVCSGDAPRDRHAIVVPLEVNPKSRLLGKSLTDQTIGIYAPGSEHADVTFSHHAMSVVVLPTQFIDQAFQSGMVLPASGSHLFEGMGNQLALKDLLRRLLQLQREAGIPSAPEVQRSLQDEMSRTLQRALTDAVKGEAVSALGRPQIPRTAILRRVSQILRQRREEPIYATELAAEVGISQPSMQRAFQELFGMSPARYLAAKRMYLARKRLREGTMPSVTEVASSLGFWDLSRFAKSYKDLFLESPSETLKNAKRV